MSWTRAGTGWHVPPASATNLAQSLGRDLARGVLQAGGMPVTVEDVHADPAPEHEPRGIWGPTEEHGWGTRLVPRLRGPTPPMPKNMWDAVLEGYQPTAEDHEHWANQLAPDAELGPAITNADGGAFLDLSFLDFLR